MAGTMSDRSTTPRVTRSRGQTPMPALEIRQSHAYGARGKAPISQQVTTSAAEFQQAFVNTRQRAPQRAPSEASSTAASTNRGRNARASRPVVAEEEAIIEEAAPATSANGTAASRVAESARSGFRPITSIRDGADYSDTSSDPPPPPPPQQQQTARFERLRPTLSKGLIMIFFLVALSISLALACAPVAWKALEQKLTSTVSTSVLRDQATGHDSEWLKTYVQDLVKSHVAEATSRERYIRTDDLPAVVLEAQRSFKTHVSTAVFNSEKALHEINYAGVGTGALVDAGITSDTRHPASGFVYAVGRWLYIWSHEPNPPSSALTAWAENSQCWCAQHSEDEKAKAQLGIIFTSGPIYPGEITIEHIPAQGTRDIAAAPKDFELWAEVANETEAVRIHTAIHGEVAPFRTDGACSGWPPNGQSNWVCLGANRYDIHAPNHVQSFGILPDAVGLEAATERVAVRVLQNWGADHTCVYRVRITGTEAGRGGD